MTVRELIAELEKIENKEKVVIYFNEGDEEVEGINELNDVVVIG